MAKKVANMKERKAAEEERNNKRRNTRETVRRRTDGSLKNRQEIGLSLKSNKSFLLLFPYSHFSHTYLVLGGSSVHVSEHVRRSRARTDPGRARPVTRCHETPGSSPPATLA